MAGNLFSKGLGMQAGQLFLNMKKYQGMKWKQFIHKGYIEEASDSYSKSFFFLFIIFVLLHSLRVQKISMLIATGLIFMRTKMKRKKTRKNSVCCQNGEVCHGEWRREICNLALADLPQILKQVKLEPTKILFLVLTSFLPGGLCGEQI